MKNDRDPATYIDAGYAGDDYVGDDTPDPTEQPQPRPLARPAFIALFGVLCFAAGVAVGIAL